MCIRDSFHHRAKGPVFTRRDDKDWITIALTTGYGVPNYVRQKQFSEMIRLGQLSAGQGRALVGVPDPIAMAQRAFEEKLTVRELEKLSGAEKRKTRPGKAGSSAAPKSADTRALEKRIEEALGLKADLKLRGLGEQTLLTLEIRDFDQLDTVVDRLTRR